MLISEIWDGYEERMKLLNPFFTFGKGMELGPSINPYIENILMAALLELFYREVRNSEARKESDIKEIIRDVMAEMKIDATEKEIERLVAAMLYSSPQTLDSYKRPYYSHNKQTFLHHKFSYLVADQDAMGKNPEIIYRLTDDSQFIIFSSREITAELSITLEQLYLIQLLKKGNIDGVLKQTQFLLNRVRTLINKEKDYGKRIAREPKIILQNSFDDKSKREKEIQNQFKEEEENFQKMFTMLYRLEEKNEGLYDEQAKKRMNEIREHLRLTTNKHAEFNTLVTKNIAFIIDIRTNRPDLLIKNSSIRFRENYWEGLIQEKGIVDVEIFDKTLSPLLSPVSPDLFSLERIWERQAITKRDVQEELEEEDKEKVEVKAYSYHINWDNILSKWMPIMTQLIEKGEFSIKSFTHLKGWSKDAIELWVQFSKEKFIVPSIIQVTETYEDDREEFIKRLIVNNPRFKKIQSCVIYIEKDSSILLEFDKTVVITAGTLYLKRPKKVA
ncbi:hypothetical protein [Evansella tamaricis]|uniref:Uncharacterized protein n=1 Tax=Evansella tamaricis TaxID=2069301 RepID=A0ABS6JA93_9BACI|nr:hypothetical protein [Evansella tamaricis]MBU9710530.1 hypothetical protein [Evansella tamaricis]